MLLYTMILGNFCNNEGFIVVSMFITNYQIEQQPKTDIAIINEVDEKYS